MMAPPPDYRTSGTEDDKPSRPEILAPPRTRAPGILRADAEDRCVFVNEAWCELTGIPRERFLESAWRDELSATELAHLGLAKRALGRGESVHAEYRVTRPDGRRRRLQLDIVPELDAEGRVTGQICTLLDVTRPREAEHRLREQLDELETIYAVAPVGLCYVDEGLRYVRVNQIYAEIVGRPVEEVVGRTMAEVVHPMAREQAVGIARRAIESGEPVMGSEIRSITPSDPPEQRVWLINVLPVRSEQRIVGAMAVLQDVTGLKQIQRDLERAQQLAGVGCWWWNLLDDTGWWSEELYRILGLEPGSVPPSYEDYFQMVHPADRAELRRLMERTLSDGAPASTSYRIVRPDGSVRRIESVALVERSPGGAPLRIIGTLQDATPPDPA